MMMKKLLLLPILLATLFSYAQNYADKDYYLVDSLILEDLSEYDRTTIDSCLKIYHNTKQDTGKAIIITEIIDRVESLNIWPKYNSWLYYYTRDRINNKEAKELYLEIYANTLNNKGLVYYMKGNYKKSIELYTQSLNINKKIDNENGVANLLSNIGSVYFSRGEYEKSIGYYEKGLKIEEKNENKKGIAVSLNNIGMLYKMQKDFNKSLEYYKKSLKIKNEIGAKNNSIAISLNNIGAIHKELNQLDKALEYFLKALKITEKTAANTENSAVLSSNIGTIYENQDKLDEAKKYYEKSIAIFVKISNKSGEAKSLSNLGKIYNDQGNIKKAKEIANKSYRISKKIGYPDQIQQSSLLLSQIAKKEKNWKEAYEMYKLSTKMRDSITNERNQKTVIKSQFKYKYEKQSAIDSIQYAEAQKITDAQLAEGEAKLEAKRLQQYFLMGGIISLFIIGGLVFIYYRNKQKSALEIAQKDTIIEKQQSIQNKLKALSAQMNPHFIFNSLNSIQYYIVKNDIGNSKLFLRKFAGLMRKTLDNSEYTFISLEDELEALKEYIELERLRLDDKFEYSINVDSNIDPDDVNIPTLLIQPYVENAIWHGIAKKKEQGRVTIDIKKEDDRILCVVDDNGVGRLKSQNIENNNHKSYAMNITKARLDLINTLEDDIININIIDKTDKEGNPTGTTVQLFIPDDL